MNKIQAFYFDLFKIILIALIFFALFGTLNDLLWELLSGSSIDELMRSSRLLRSLFYLQFIGCTFLIYLFYRNQVQAHGWLQSKKRKRLSRRSNMAIVLMATVFIITPYVFFLITLSS